MARDSSELKSAIDRLIDAQWAFARAEIALEQSGASRVIPNDYTSARAIAYAPFFEARRALERMVGVIPDSTVDSAEGDGD